MVLAKFVLSAASVSDFPQTGLPEIALVGRSNVGKSSLINALVKQKVARTSAAPGKTRLANYYLIESLIPNHQSRERPFYLVDLPGYGYARGGRESVETFEALTAQYFDPSTRPERRLAGVLHLIDARHPELDRDAAAHRWLFQTGIPVAVVITKVDKLTRSEKTKALQALEARYEVPILPESALDETGLEEIWKVLRQWMQR